MMVTEEGDGGRRRVLGAIHFEFAKLAKILGQFLHRHVLGQSADPNAIYIRRILD